MSEELAASKSVTIADDDGGVTKPEEAIGVYNQDDGDGKGRERFSSRIAFYFTAIGAAIGFGNVWRFPALAKDYGGGAVRYHA